MREPDPLSPDEETLEQMVRDYLEDVPVPAPPRRTPACLTVPRWRQVKRVLTSTANPFTPEEARHLASGCVWCNGTLAELRGGEARRSPEPKRPARPSLGVFLALAACLLLALGISVYLVLAPGPASQPEYAVIETEWRDHTKLGPHQPPEPDVTLAAPRLPRDFTAVYALIERVGDEFTVRPNEDGECWPIQGQAGQPLTLASVRRDTARPKTVWLVVLDRPAAQALRASIAATPLDAWPSGPAPELPAAVVAGLKERAIVVLGVGRATLAPLAR